MHGWMEKEKRWGEGGGGFSLRCLEERARELEFTIFIELCYFTSKKDAMPRFDVVYNCDLLMDGKTRRRAEKCCLSLIV